MVKSRLENWLDLRNVYSMPANHFLGAPTPNPKAIFDGRVSSVVSKLESDKLTSAELTTNSCCVVGSIRIVENSR